MLALYFAAVNDADGQPVTDEAAARAIAASFDFPHPETVELVDDGCFNLVLDAEREMLLERDGYLSLRSELGQVEVELP